MQQYTEIRLSLTVAISEQRDVRPWECLVALQFCEFDQLHNCQAHNLQSYERENAFDCIKHEDDRL